MDGVHARFRTYRDNLDPTTELTIHGRHDPALGDANTVIAAETGAVQIDHV
ncbi:hypothetical protein [Streptomyces gilvifuscus]|uniref:hypothetical protein n=1 Tax=Streptomyces gilvifuscus TaxID=1550617 RepID=UPI002FEDE585